MQLLHTSIYVVRLYILNREIVQKIKTKIVPECAFQSLHHISTRKRKRLLSVTIIKLLGREKTVKIAFNGLYIMILLHCCSLFEVEP